MSEAESYSRSSVISTGNGVIIFYDNPDMGTLDNEIRMAAKQVSNLINGGFSPVPNLISKFTWQERKK